MIKKYEKTLQGINQETTIQMKLKKLIELQPSNYSLYLTQPKFGFSELLNQININTPLLQNNEYTLATKIYWIINNITTFPLCSECKIGTLEHKNVYSVQQGYKDTTCSKICKNIKATKQRKNTMVQHYGVENNWARKDIIKQIGKTNIKKYGSKCPVNGKEQKKQIKKNNLEKFGTEFYSSTQECKDKVKNTNIEKLGVDNPMKCEECKQKSRNKWLQTLGVDHPFKSKKILDEIKQQRIIKYGENYKQILWGNKGNIGQNKRAYQYMLKSIKIRPLFTCDEYIQMKKAGIDAFKFECIQCHKSFYSNWDNGLPTRACPYCGFNGGISEAEREIYRLCVECCGENKHINTNDRNIIAPLELDIVIPHKKIAIEYDGLYWHNDDIKTDYKYHLNKTELCENQGIQLIHIFENEWLTKQDIVKSRIKNLLGIYDKTIFARKCKLKGVSVIESRSFQDENHLQGAVNTKVNLGLYFNNELVSLMTFSKPRFDKRHEWELVRFCNKLGYHIPGAAGKLLKYFEKTYKPKNLVSYADRRWSQGKLYKAIGFQLDHISAPNYWYFKTNSIVLESRVKYQKHKQQKIFKNFNSTQSEVENMKNNGYSRIFDCGNLVFVKNYSY